MQFLLITSASSQLQQMETHKARLQAGTSPTAGGGSSSAKGHSRAATALAGAPITGTGPCPAPREPRAKAGSYGAGATAATSTRKSWKFSGRAKAGVPGSAGARGTSGVGSHSAAGPGPAAGLAGAGQRGRPGHPVKWTAPHPRHHGPASTCQPRRRGSGNKPAGRHKTPKGRAGAGAAPDRQQRALPGAALAGPPVRTAALPGAYPAGPPPVLHPFPHRAPASRAHLRGLEPGRPGLAPLRARSPLACAAAASSLPGHLRVGCGGAEPQIGPPLRGRAPPMQTAVLGWGLVCKLRLAVASPPFPPA